MAYDALTTQTPRAVLIGNGTRGPYTLNDSSGNPIRVRTHSHLVVRRYSSTTDETGTALALNTDYTVNNTDVDVVTITLTVAQAVVASTERLVVTRLQSLADVISLSTGGNFSAETLSAAMSVITEQLQEVRRDVDRSIKVDWRETAERAIPLPPASSVGAIGRDADGSIRYLTAADLSTDVLLGSGQAEVLAESIDWTDLASAATTELDSVSNRHVRITGTATITSFGTATSGLQRVLRFTTALTLTHNATSLILPGGATLTTAANDTAEFVSLGSGNWLCTNYSRARLTDVVNVRDWGAVGDNSTDDTAAINAAIAYAQASLSQRVIYFPRGTYLISASLTAVLGNNWHFIGDGRGSSIIRSTADDDIITADVRAFSSSFGSIQRLRLQGPAAASTSSVGFRALGSTGSATGVQYWTFDFDAQNVYKGMLFDETGMSLWSGTNQISAHGYNIFNNFETLPQTSTNPTYIAIEFVGSLNLHNLFIGGRYRGTHRGFKAGKDQTYCSVGDTVFIGVHFLAGTSGVGSSVELTGGSDASCYNENLQMIGCQYECSVAPLILTRMYNCRFMGSNTNTLQPIFVDCDEDSIWYEVRGVAHIPGAVGTNKNYAHNGAKRVWQRGTSFVPSVTTFMDDRWKGRRASNAAGSTYSRQAGFSGAQYCMRIQRDNGNAATDAMLYGHQIESAECYGLQGKTIVVSAEVRCGASYSGGNITINIFSGTGVDEVFNVATGFATGNVNEGSSAITPTTTAQRLSSSAAALGSNITELGVSFVWTPSGTAGATDYVEITNVKIEVSPVASAFVPPSVEEELSVCRRFYQKSFDLATTPAQNLGNGTGETTFVATIAGAVTNRSGRIPFSPRMRASTGLAMTLYNSAAANAQIRDQTAAADTSAAATVNVTESGFHVTCTGNAGTTVGGVLGFHWAADAEID